MAAAPCQAGPPQYRSWRFTCTIRRGASLTLTTTAPRLAKLLCRLATPTVSTTPSPFTSACATTWQARTPRHTPGLRVVAVAVPGAPSTSPVATEADSSSEAHLLARRGDISKDLPRGPSPSTTARSHVHGLLRGRLGGTPGFIARARAVTPGKRSGGHTVRSAKCSLLKARVSRRSGSRASRSPALRVV